MSELEVAACSGLPPAWLTKLVDHWCRTSATVITFNYDTLVEQAFFQSDSPRNGRDEGDLYVLPNTHLNVIDGGRLYDFSNPGLFELSKLHGSLSWSYAGPDTPPSSPVFRDTLPRRWLRVPDGIVPADSSASPFYARPALPSDLVPLIVPPAATKTQYYGNRAMRTQWVVASQRLATADNFICMGYSFPATDNMVSGLFRANLSAHADCVSVDPSRDAADRLQSLIPSGRILRRFASVDAFVQSLADPT